MFPFDKTANDNLFIPIGDISPLIEEVCKEHIRRIDQLKFKFKLFFTKDTNSEDKLLLLLILTVLTENIPDEIDSEKDTNKFVREMVFEENSEKNAEACILTYKKWKIKNLSH